MAAPGSWCLKHILDFTVVSLAVPSAQDAPHPQLGFQRVLSLGPECRHTPVGTKKACVFPWPITLALEPESFMDEKTLCGHAWGLPGSASGTSVIQQALL